MESEDISDLIQPLGSENTGRWMNSVLDRILPDLKSSLDAEYGRERDEMESEHKSRLQETATYFPVVYVRRYRRRCLRVHSDAQMPLHICLLYQLVLSMFC